MKDKKEKKLKNLVRLIYNEMREENNPVKVESSYYNADWGEYDQEVSEKLKTMVLNLINYRDNLNININTYSFSISTDNLSGVKLVKNYNSNQNYAIKANSDDDYLSIEVMKDNGFSINKGYNNRSQYKDVNLYNDLLPIVTKKLKEINAEKFQDIWDNIMKESGLLRDNNIDQLLNKLDEIKN